MLLALARAPGAEERDDGQVQWVLGGSPAGYFNCVVRAELQDDAAITAFTNRLRARSLAGTWHLGPTMRPTDLAMRLLEHGFEWVGDDVGMQRDLVNLPEPHRVDGLTIERVVDDRQLRIWTATMVRAFNLPVDWIEWFEQRGRALGSATWTHWLGLLDGEPVATTTLFEHAGLAGIHNVGTLPSARGRGIASALTLGALHAAQARDLKQVVLHATELGQPVYERLGFQTICASGLYRWRAQS
jgi:ribosomal protein S18 acetylase RimI-like enzyme